VGAMSNGMGSPDDRRMGVGGWAWATGEPSLARGGASRQGERPLQAGRVLREAHLELDAIPAAASATVPAVPWLANRAPVSARAEARRAGALCVWMYGYIYI